MSVPHVAAMGKPQLSGKKILVVDDNAINLDIAVETLSYSGAAVEAAASGDEALGRIVSVRYDLILLDLTMPGVDGTTVGKAIRASEGNARTPILLFTASDNAEALLAAATVGAQGLVAKPVDVDDLLAQVVEHVARSQMAIGPSASIRPQ
jgi:CheY-like chemotaxis protein